MSKAPAKVTEEKTESAAPAPAKKFGVFDEQGYPVGFYDDSIHTEIPEGAIEITTEQWEEFLSENGTRVWDKKTASVKTAAAKKIIPTIEQVRGERNRLLAATDWTQLGDAALSEQEKTAYKNYRTALREMTDDIDLENFEWPVSPA